MQLRFIRQAGSVRNWAALSVLASLGMLALSAVMLLELRQDAWDRARQTSSNLLQVIERDIARNIEIIDLSLRAVIDNLKAPGLDAISPELRQLVLFDRAASARDMGLMLVLDEHGRTRYDSAGYPPRPAEYADRPYFQAHRGQDGLGLVISRPLMSKLLNAPVIVISRRINKPDGSFGGVVLSSLKLSYFENLFRQLSLGPEGAVNVYHHDGTRIARFPVRGTDIGENIARSSNFSRFLTGRHGELVSISVRDGVERYYAFSTVGEYPMLVNVALATQDIEEGWRAKAFVIGLAVIALCGLTTGLSVLFGREIRRRAAMQGELARLSNTDVLTGLANRRRFEELSRLHWLNARRSAQPMSLLVVDADHFKTYNDRFGHAVGDEVLKALAASLEAAARRPHDGAFRVGGEEFVLLLPETDATGAQKVAALIHRNVARIDLQSAGIPAGSITVSVGAATGVPPGPDEVASDLYRAADKALYEAKAGGRNQTRAAATIGPHTVPATRLAA